jgi:putative DNA primase/helicase
MIARTIDISSSTLLPEHTRELVKRRGLPLPWCEVNCRSITAKEASDRLGYRALSGGIWIEGDNFQAQYKPDKPWKSDGEGRSPKYRSPLGEYDAILPRHPVDDRYWSDFAALKEKCYIVDGNPSVIVTEGFFKALMGCSIGLPTVSLIGVEMGLTPKDADPQGKRYLVESLERLARAGFGFIHAFDADCATKPEVVAAQRKLAHQIAKFSVPQYIATGLWTVDEGKGMDDYIQKNGEDAFRREVLAKSIPFEAWEAQFKKLDSPKEITPRQAAKKLVERYRHEWKFDLERQTWRHWDKVWNAVQDEVFTQVVYRDLDTMSGVQYSTFSYVENVVKFLKTELLEKEWQTFNRIEWIAFRDSVLHVSTGQTHEHAPGFGFTSCLEHDYPKFVAIDRDSSILHELETNAPTFYAWAMHAQKGDPLKVLKLLAVCNGVLKFRFFDLQLFLLLIGVPGAGKGTFARLLESMVGKPNHASAKLHKLGEDNVLAAIIDKQLVVCPDEKKAGSDYSGLLSLTGGDSIPYRPIYKPQANGRFFGAVVVIANQYPFYGDTTGIARRECLVNFDTPITNRDTSVERKIQSEVGAIMALSLSLQDRQVTELLTGTGEAEIPDFRRQQWLHKTENDSVALFIEEHIVHSESSSILLGGKGGDRGTLYGAYLAFCEENNSKSPFSRQTFRSHFLELCRDLGWNDVEARRKTNGWMVSGVRLLVSGETTPHVSDLVVTCRPCRPDVDPPVDPNPLQGKGYVDHVDVLPLLSRKEENNFPSSSAKTADGGGAKENGSFADGNPLPEVYTSTEAVQAKGLGSTSSSTGGLHGLHDIPQTIEERIRSTWEDVTALGELILSLTASEVTKVLEESTEEEVAHLKDAASSAWKPGLSRDAVYKGERVEIWEADQSRNVTVRTRAGTMMKVKRGDLRPWLGI